MPPAVDIVSSAWLRENVGEPTNKIGSTYSKIVKAMVEAEKVRSAANLKKVFDLSLAWSQSKHKNAKTDEQKQMKAEQQLNLNRFMNMLQADWAKAAGSINDKDYRTLLFGIKADDKAHLKEKQMVFEMFDQMQDSPVPLVKNTGKYLKSKILTFKSIRLSSGMTNGSMDLNGVLSINPVMAYNPSELQGLLVHEVHHDLCFHSGSSKAWGSDLSGTALYIDEFVAHLKQYSVTRPAASEAARIESVNKVLAINYRKAVDDWTRSGFRLVESFADLGDFAVPDNAKRERCLYHGCAPTRGRAVSVRA